MVQRWRPLFDTSDHKVQKLAVWVRIPNLPMELYNDHFLWRVGSMLGTMLRVDENTSVHSRGRFARLCIEVDLQRELVPSFTVLGKEFKVEYEGLHLICFCCGKYGHRIEQCPDSKSATKTAVDNLVTNQAATEGTESSPTVIPEWINMTRDPRLI